MPRFHAAQPHTSPTGGSGAGNCRRDDPVGKDAVVYMVNAFPSADHNRVSPCPADLTAHLLQIRLQRADFRLSRSAADDGLPCCGGSSKHDVFGCADTGKRQPDFSSAEPFGAADDLVAGLLDLGTQLSECRKMQVDRPLPKLTAPRRAQPGFSAACQQRTHKNDRGAHFQHQLMRDGTGCHAACIYVNLIVALLRHAAEVTQDTQRGIDVL